MTSRDYHWTLIPYLSLLLQGIFLPFNGTPLLAQEAKPNVVHTHVRGIVVDPSESPVKEVLVRLLRPSGGLVAQAATDGNGTFHFGNVSKGTYRIEVDLAGFKQFSTDIKVANTPLSLHIALTLAVINETVVVNSESSSSQISTDPEENRSVNTIAREQLDRIPVFDQDYLTTLSRFLSDDTLATSGISLVVNGLESNGPGVTASAIQAVKINQNPYSALFARPGRARLEITTKPGTPDFHGSVTFFTRNSVFDARNAFAIAKPAESRYYGEGYLTGPLGHNRRNTFLVSMQQDDDNVAAVVFATGTNNSVLTDNVPAPSRHFFGSFQAFHDFTNGDQFWIGYSYEYLHKTNQGVGGLVLREAGYNMRTQEQEINGSYRHIVSATWVNQLRFLLGQNDEPVTSAVDAPAVVVEGYFTGGGAQADSRRTEAHFQGTDIVSYASGMHRINFGLETPDLSRRGADDFTNSLGTYTFSDIIAFASGRPSNFEIQQGNGHLVFWQREAAGFFEDNLKLRQNLSVNLGIRYYYQNYFNDDANNFAPRFSVAYAPWRGGRTVLRAGAGTFFDRTGPRAIADLLHFNSENLLRLYLPQATGGFVPYPVTQAELASIPPSVVILNPHARIPYVEQYSFGIERQLTAQSTFTATYVGSRGIDLFLSRDANAPLPPLYGARPSEAYGQERQIDSDGYQKSNSLELTFRGRASRYFSGQAQYALGKTYNNTSGNFPGNSNYPWLDWARSDNDRRNKFDLLGTVTPGDLLSVGIALQAYSGKPVNVTTGLDSNGDGIFNDRPLAGLAPRNSLHGPALVNVDVNIQRDFHFRKEKTKDRTLTVALNVFNVLNHVNDLTYNGVIGSDGGPLNPQFGRANLAYPARRFQLNFEYKF